MLARYKIYRGKRPPDDPLPEGIRQDTRYRTKHCLRPSRELVETYLATPVEAKGRAWKTFERAYLAILNQRCGEDRAPFGRLAKLARDEDVYLGCSCPTKKNPDVSQCHTVPALRFMKHKYPQLQVEFPQEMKPGARRAEGM